MQLRTPSIGNTSSVQIMPFLRFKASHQHLYSALQPGVVLQGAASGAKQGEANAAGADGRR